MSLKTNLSSTKTTAVGVIALLIAVLQIVSGIISSGVEAVDWGTIVPLLLTSIMGLFAKDADRVDPPAAS